MYYTPQKSKPPRIIILPPVWALELGGPLRLLHPWAVPVASYRALGPSGARK